ncbi:MAG: hypothetical protein WCC51_17125 [Stenotrophomonas indicatrix]|uniref:hypothetical protein n=1 Tax=Stenotrophomonas indicatrix TaxID=2045451 RepID=UPI003C7B9C61
MNPNRTRATMLPLSKKPMMPVPCPSAVDYDLRACVQQAFFGAAEQGVVENRNDIAGFPGQSNTPISLLSFFSSMFAAK